MKTGKTFSLTIVTFDRKRKKGGEVITYQEAVLCQKAKTPKNRHHRPLTKEEQLRSSLANEDHTRRNPHHKKNYTRNIQLMQNGHPTSARKKIHPPLVVEFDGKKVIS